MGGDDVTGALRVADLYNSSDHSTIGSLSLDASDHEYPYHISDHSTIDDSYDEDEDSFLANNSLCREHKSTLRMLDSLRKEVVQMARGEVDTSNGETGYPSPKTSPKDVMIDINHPTTNELSSPLGSPTLLRNTLALSQKVTPVLPSFSNGRDGDQRRHSNDDNSTFCSMDHSIEQELTVLKEVAKELEQELREATIQTVFEAVERIEDSREPATKGLLTSENKEVLKEGIRKELHSSSISRGGGDDEMHDFSIQAWMECIVEWEGGAMNLKVLAVAILVGLIRDCIRSWIY